MRVVMWGAFIEKGDFTEEEILGHLGYSTSKVQADALGFESAVLHVLRKSATEFPKQIFTKTTPQNYLILVDGQYSRVSSDIEEEQLRAHQIGQGKLYKFTYDNYNNEVAFAVYAEGELERYLYCSAHLGPVEYGRQLRLEPETKVA
ncbi:MAG: hypothetical protein AAFY48_22570, partial [Bacteroidota bacterium]